MKKILYVVADGAPGGGATFALSLIRSLARTGEVSVALATQAGSYALAQAQAFGVPATGLEFMGSRIPFRCARALASLVRETAPDLVHAHGSRAGFFVACVPRRSDASPRVAYTVLGYHFLRKPAGLRTLAARAERFAHARADVSIHECRYDERLAFEWRLVAPTARHTVIFNGIDRADFPPAGSADRRLVAFLGRLVPQKDPELLAEIAGGLARAGYRLRVIGSGESEAAFRARVRQLGAETQVEMHGAVPRARGLALLAGAGALVLPSRWEGMPIAPIEAMALGVPVVAASVSGIPEIIEHGVSGELVGERRAAPYVAALRRLCEDEPYRAATIAAGQRLVDSKFTRVRNTEAHLALYRELLA